MIGSAENPGTPARRPRGRGRVRRQAGAVHQRPWAQPRNPYPPIDAVSVDELESIHQTALTVLEEIGVDFLNDEARAVMAGAGARVEAGTKRVRIDRHLVETALTTVPQSFTLHARNPNRNIRLGDGYIAFSAVGSAPNCACLDHGRRPGNRADYQTFLKLGHMLNSVHMWGGYPVEPIDLHPATRHLDALADMVTMSDKAIHGYSLGRERVCDAMEISRIARGVSRQQFEAEPGLITVINSNSPLVLDDPMLVGIMEMAKAGQIIVLTPFTLAGAMAPVTLAGALAQANAEVLAGMVISQLVRPGAPFMYGGFTSNVDMKSGAPAFGTPEAMKAALVGGQLARRYGVPYRSSNVNTANGLDMQAAYESVFSLWGAVMGGVNLLKHAAGWMEGGLQASFEKMVLDADMLAMVSEFLTPLPVTGGDLALDAMREVGPGGHFFGAAHTQSRYESAFFAPMISDWRNYERWEEAGRPDARDKANRIYKELVAAYTAPAMEASIAEELAAFVARRKQEGGAPTDF